jgi:hypothetical protein
VNSSHFGSIVCVTVVPDQIKVILELPLGLVLFLFYFLQHCLQVHRIRYTYTPGDQIQINGDKNEYSD